MVERVREREAPSEAEADSTPGDRKGADHQKDFRDELSPVHWLLTEIWIKMRPG